MPSAYTQALHDGEQSFAEFALDCSRAFGALIDLKDEPEAPIPDEFRPSDYHERELAAAMARLRIVSTWTEESATFEADRAYERELSAHVREREQRVAIRARYEDMLRDARAWQPPTEEHVELSKFMIQQLESSIDFDCSPLRDEPARLSGLEYKAQRESEASRDVAYHAKCWKEDIERAQGRTQWLRALRKSLEVPACAS